MMIMLLMMMMMIYVFIFCYIYIQSIFFFFENHPSKFVVIWVKRRQKAVFVTQRSSKIIVTNEKERTKTKIEEKERRRRRRRKKAMVALLVFITETCSIRVFIENRKPQNVTWPRPWGHVCSLQFTFEPQEGLPAVRDLRQGFLPLKIVREPRV